MTAEELLDELGYAENPHFLRAGTSDFSSAPYCGHVLRHAHEDLPAKLHSSGELLGVYTLEQGTLGGFRGRVPLVYVCHVDDTADLPELHRLVWCQDIVPFVLVHTPMGIQLHSGFQYQKKESGKYKGILQPLQNFNLCQDLIQEFQASSINSGAIWHTRRKDVTPSKRVDWQLLGNLKRLEKRLRDSGLARKSSHALIGKYVFLRYLRDRGILSDRKLAGWGLKPEDAFGRQVTVKGLRTCIDAVEDWLNGGVFPIKWTGGEAPKAEHVRAVAATFFGDAPVGDDYWQLTLDFEAYDFSYIPIETLSVIYEQFLHAPDESGASKGKAQGAYYTPIPLVNLMLAQAEQYRPIQVGTRILDPSCGSGAFLVQAYRRLIETTYPAETSHPTPVQLRELLTRHIFGVDQDLDACCVTELSLQMTLLDRVNPPDLEESAAHQRFKLPSLRDTNIIHADFFDEDSAPLKALKRRPFGLVVGNPPWKSINPNKLKKEDKNAWEWIKHNGLQKGSSTPVAGNQIAQAFVWKLQELGRERDSVDTEVAFLIPGMALFEDRSKSFRRRFFSGFEVHSVINFANLAEVLFAGRSRVPAAAFFFRIPTDGDVGNGGTIRVCSPLVANQEANRGVQEGDRPETWTIEIQESEFRDIEQAAVATGSGLPWKVAQWGSHLDIRLLSRLKKRFPTLGQLEGRGTSTNKLLLASQGLELRKKEAQESLEELPEVVGKPKLNVKKLARMRHIFAFPNDALKEKVSQEERFVRARRGELPLKVCRPPHVIVSAARTFAVYADDYLIVPPRQIGIVHLNDDHQFLKALSLYLSSDFAFYHQFFTSTQFGVQRGRATLASLRKIPVPLVHLSARQIGEWSNLHSRLCEIPAIPLDSSRRAQTQMLFADTVDLQVLLGELNSLVFDALELSEREQSLVHDLVGVRLHLNDGKIGAAATSSPNAEIMKRYASRLSKELNSIAGDVASRKYVTEVLYGESSSMIVVDFVNKSDRTPTASVRPADRAETKELTKTHRCLRDKFSQWIYLNRNLRVYEGRRTYVLKPMQMFHWTEGQAMADAADIITESLSAGDDV